MDGSRLVSSPPPRPASKPPPNFRPLIYLAIVLALIGAVWVFRPQITNLKSQISNQLLSQTPTPFPEWMTYSNQDFSFTYPGSWGLPSKTLTGCGSIESIVDPTDQYEITIATKCNYDNTTGQKFSSLEGYLKESPSKISYTTIDSIKVAKITSYLASSKSATEIVFMTPSETIFSISLGRFTISDYPEPLPDTVLPIFTNILDTLNFSK